MSRIAAGKVPEADYSRQEQQRLEIRMRRETSVSRHRRQSMVKVAWQEAEQGNQA
jgi:hypothetical protein